MPDPNASTTGPESPSFWDVALGRRRDLAEETAAVAAAAAAGVFHALEEEPGPAAGLARRLDLEPRPLEILLAFLADVGLLTDGGGSYDLTDRARRRLADPTSPEYAAGGLPLWLGNLGAFIQLPEVLETGGPVEDDGGPPEGERLARFMAAMDAAPRERIRRLVDLCLERAPEARHVLDLGGGPGHMSKEFARRGLDVVLFDLPETVAFVASEYGLEDEEAIRLERGDFNEDSLPAGPFDIVLLSNILHIYGPSTNQRIVEKVAGVTEEGGVCAIADFIRGVSPRAPRFALVMLLKTEEGNTYTEEEYAAWLRDGGFRDPRLEHLDEDRQLLTAIRT